MNDGNMLFIHIAFLTDEFQDSLKYFNAVNHGLLKYFEAGSRLRSKQHTVSHLSWKLTANELNIS